MTPVSLAASLTQARWPVLLAGWGWWGWGWFLGQPVVTLSLRVPRDDRDGPADLEAVASRVLTQGHRLLGAGRQEDKVWCPKMARGTTERPPPPPPPSCLTGNRIRARRTKRSTARGRARSHAQTRCRLYTRPFSRVEGARWGSVKPHMAFIYPP